MAKKIGVDFGGSWLRVGVIDPDVNGGQVGEIVRYPSPPDWASFVGLLAPYNAADVAGFGVAVAGPIKDHAVVVKGPNLHWLDGQNVRAGLQAALGKPVVVSNDMEAATEGELACGVLRHYRWAIFDTISTGWGGNLVLDGRRVDSEPGHTNTGFDPAFPCGCGNLGCNEALYSGSAMERRLRDYLDTQRLTVSPDAGLWDVFDREADAGTGWAVGLLDDWAEGVGRAWANVLNRIRPMQAIVYMGTTAENMLARPRVADRLRATVRRICMFPEHKAADFPIVPAAEPNRAIYGAVRVFDRLA